MIMNPTFTARRRSLACFLLALVPVPGLGQSSDPLGEVTLFDEEEFTIQAATRTELPISKAPGSVTVISAQQIRESSGSSGVSGKTYFLCTGQRILHHHAIVYRHKTTRRQTSESKSDREKEEKSDFNKTCGSEIVVPEH